MSHKLFLLLFLLLSSELPIQSREEPCIVNIINFVRKTEPRPVDISDAMLLETTRNEAECMRQNGLKGTFLLQYDALIDPQYVELMRQLPKDCEIGAWWEITQPHVEAAGMKWRGRYPWDWHANVGFATGYTTGQRERLVDVYMQKFKDIFGYYPHSVGSWFIDAHTLKYMRDKYHISASCNCRDQVGTDGYTMWGGYWQGAYYPSVNNAYIPAQTKESQIDIPVFRMLGSDPLYQYECGIGGVAQSVSTLEPVWDAGKSNKWVDWYFNVETQDPAMGYTYFQAGQENSFSWPKMKQGYEMQMAKIGQLAKQNVISVMTLGEAGHRFAKRYKLTPATASTAMSDYTSHDGKTLWFNSRFYRTNLFWSHGSFRFRDIQKYDQDYKSLYLDTPGTSTECHYYALPVVDGCLWSVEGDTAGLRIIERGRNGVLTPVKCYKPIIKTTKTHTIVTMTSLAGATYTITMDERNIVISSNPNTHYFLVLNAAPQAHLPFTNIGANSISATSGGQNYQVKVKKGKAESLTETRNAIFKLTPQQGKIVLDMSQY